jgi:hypothetical protein
MPRGIVTLPELGNAREGVRSALPAFPLNTFDRIAAMYKSRLEHTAESSAKVASRLDHIARSAVDLRSALLMLSEEAQGALWEGSLQVGRVGIAEEMIAGLYLLGRAAQIAHNQAKDGIRVGRPTSPRHAMVWAFARELEKISVKADATENGWLVFLARSVFVGYGEEVTGVRELVRDALGKMPARAENSPR